ncbi:unnamed protein product [Prorocentrum cordatum]|uniref:Uncharacterized protein n=1 Tax=Prorocentrum cordatum TaxID=2364126 RepID=A0ABN9TNP0_9DINO|nr:unnamed protein product [Polarella glacialis]
MQLEVGSERLGDTETDSWQRLVGFYGAAAPAIEVLAVHELNTRIDWRTRKAHRLNVPAQPVQPGATIVSAQHLKGTHTVLAIGRPKNFSEFAAQWVAMFGLVFQVGEGCPPAKAQSRKGETDIRKHLGGSHAQGPCATPGLAENRGRAHDHG